MRTLVFRQLGRKFRIGQTLQQRLGRRRRMSGNEVGVEFVEWITGVPGVVVSTKVILPSYIIGRSLLLVSWAFFVRKIAPIITSKTEMGRERDVDFVV